MQIACIPLGLKRLSPPGHNKMTGRLGTSTKTELRVLCYQHHTEMLAKFRSEPLDELLYACREPGCLICYGSSDGYFIDTEDTRIIEQEITPRVSCPYDGQFMYLVEVLPERSSFRLWKCPGCDASRTNEGSSDALGKTRGA